MRHVCNKGKVNTMTNKEYFNMIKDKLTWCREPLMRGDNMAYCPFHGDGKEKNASLSVNFGKGMWHCFGCDASFDGGRLKDLAKKLGFDVPDIREDKLKEAKELCRNSFNFLHSPEGSAHRQIIFEQRGISVKALKKAGVGYSREIRVYTLPIIKKGELKAVKIDRGRGEDDRYTWVYNSKYKGVFGCNLIPGAHKEVKELLLVGGEWDAIAAYDAGVPAVSSTRGEGYFSQEMFEDILELLPTTPRELTVLYDSDTAGLSGSLRVISSILQLAGRIDSSHLDVSLANAYTTKATKRDKDICDAHRFKRVLEYIRTARAERNFKVSIW